MRLANDMGVLVLLIAAAWATSTSERPFLAPQPPVERVIAKDVLQRWPGVYEGSEEATESDDAG